MSFARCCRLLCLFFLVVASTPFIATPSPLPYFAKGFTLACATGLKWCTKKEKYTRKSNSNLPWILLWSLSKRMAAIDIEIEIQFICMLPFVVRCCCWCCCVWHVNSICSLSAWQIELKSPDDCAYTQQAYTTCSPFNLRIIVSQTEPSISRAIYGNYLSTPPATPCTLQ